MKILVTAKRVVDPYVHIRFSNRGVLEVGELKHSINPFDEIAVEQAVRLKEQGVAGEVIAVSIGPLKSEEALRTALAIGADRAILIVAEAPPEPLIVAQVLAHIVKTEDIGLVLMGKQGIDGDCGQVGPMLAGLMDWPQATAAARLDVDEGRWVIACEADDGTANIAFTGPGVVTVDLRLNSPRYASLPGIMKARAKPLARTPIGILPINLEAHSEVIAVVPPPSRDTACKIVKTVDDLLNELSQKEKVI